MVDPAILRTDTVGSAATEINVLPVHPPICATIRTVSAAAVPIHVSIGVGSVASTEDGFFLGSTLSFVELKRFTLINVHTELNNHRETPKTPERFFLCWFVLGVS